MKKYIVIIFFALFCICSFLGGVHFNDFITEWNILILIFFFLGLYPCLLDNQITKELFLLFFLIILVPLIFFSGLSLIDDTFVSSINDWIGFLGAYFGVIGTIGAIWWQLNHEKKEKEEEKIEKEEKALLILGIHFREISENYKIVCEQYPNMQNFSLAIFDYNQDLINNLLFSIPNEFQNFTIQILTLFHTFSCNNHNLSNQDKFYKKYHIIFNEIFTSISNILENLDTFNSTDEILIKTELLEKRIGELQDILQE